MRISDTIRIRRVRRSIARRETQPFADTHLFAAYFGAFGLRGPDRPGDFSGMSLFIDAFNPVHKNVAWNARWTNWEPSSHNRYFQEKNNAIDSTRREVRDFVSFEKRVLRSHAR